METSRSRYFEAAAWALALTIVAGFARSFFLRQWFDVPPLATLLYVHGALFTTWVVLFLVQVRLAALRRFDLHQRLMVLAMITMIAPAVARLITLAGLGSHYLAVQVATTVAFVGWGLAHDWLHHRVVHPAFALWGTVLVISWPLRMWAAQAAAWEPIGLWVARMGS